MPGKGPPNPALGLPPRHWPKPLSVPASSSRLRPGLGARSPPSWDPLPPRGGRAPGGAHLHWLWAAVGPAGLSLSFFPVSFSTFRHFARRFWNHTCTERHWRSPRKGQDSHSGLTGAGGAPHHLGRRGSRRGWWRPALPASPGCSPVGTARAGPGESNLSPGSEAWARAPLSSGPGGGFSPPLLPSRPLYHDALGGDPHGLGDLPALVAVRVVVCLEQPLQLLQLVWREK